MKDKETVTETSDMFQKNCYFDCLPVEMVDMIFKYLVKRNGEYNPKLRLVCKSWHDRCSNTGSLTFNNNGRIREAAKYLENSGYKNLGLEFSELRKYPYELDVTDLNYLPMIVWEKIGTKIHSLRLSYCRLGDDIIRSVILYCDDLKQLVVDLKVGNMAESFCSLNMLKALKVVRPKLNAIEIKRNIQNNPFFPRHKPETKSWSRIFIHLIRIFPNINRFVSGHDDIQFRIDNYLPAFKVEFLIQHGDADKLILALCLAYSLSWNENSWKKVINALAQLRLLEVSLTFWKFHYSVEDEAALLNLFSIRNMCNSISLDLFGNLKCSRASFFRSLFLAIIDNSPKLRWFKFNASDEYEYPPNLFEHLTLLLTNPLKFHELQIGDIMLLSRSLEICGAECIEPYVWDWISNFSCIQHLFIVDVVPDEFLQLIFQHMTGLKSLEFVVGNHKNTDFALTGRGEETRVVSLKNVGYSINRLRNLEELKITYRCSIYSDSRDEEVGISDTTFQEFDFPKLRSLRSVLPKKSCTCTNMASKMPSLSKVQFEPSSNITLERLLDFVGATKSLHTLFVPQKNFSQPEGEKIFVVCPSLRFFHAEKYTDFYEPLSKEVRRVSK